MHAPDMCHESRFQLVWLEACEVLDIHSCVHSHVSVVFLVCDVAHVGTRKQMQEVQSGFALHVAGSPYQVVHCM